MTKQFTPTGPTTQALHCGDFYISYNDGTMRNPLDNLMVAIGQYDPNNLDRPETAIVIKDDDYGMFGQRFLILYGDYREAYRNLVDHGLEACIKFFVEHIEHKADASDDPPNMIYN